MKKAVIAAVALLMGGLALDDDILMIAVDEAQEFILNYTNRRNVPAACKHIWISLACDIYKLYTEEQKPESNPDSEGAPMADLLENVSSVKIDDAEVRDDITAAKYQADKSSRERQLLAETLKNYRARLHRFRLMNWRPVEGY